MAYDTSTKINAGALEETHVQDLWPWQEDKRCHGEISDVLLYWQQESPYYCSKKDCCWRRCRWKQGFWWQGGLPKWSTGKNHVQDLIISYVFSTTILQWYFDACGLVNEVPDKEQEKKRQRQTKKDAYIQPGQDVVQNPILNDEEDAGKTMTRQDYVRVTRLLEEAEFIPKRFLPSTQVTNLVFYRKMLNRVSY